MSLLESAPAASNEPAAPATPPAGEPAAPATSPVADGKAPVIDPKAAPAPEGYAAFKTPEGQEFTPETLEKFTSFAKELKLPQDKAQALLDMASGHVAALQAKQAEGWNEVCETWVKEITADKDFGGAKLKETCAQAKHAIDRFGSPALLEFLDQTGYGNNPEILKFLAKVDRATSEDKLVDGKPPANNTRTAAEIIYGTK